MINMDIDLLRALIHLAAPASALREDLEKSIHLELYDGTGDFAISSFKGLQASVAKLTNDPYVEGLAITIPPSATDKQKVSLANLAVGQLVAYLEGLTAFAGGSSRGGGNVGSPYTIQTAPQISLNHVSFPNSESSEKMMKQITSVLNESED